MILIITKELSNGRWIDFDPEQLFKVGDVIELLDGKRYEVTQISKSKVILEAVENDE